MVARPSANRNVLGKLNILGGITNAQVSSIDFKFEPSLIITAGKIDRLGGLIENFKEPLTESVRKVMMPSIAQNFAVGGRPRWEPWSEATIEIRQHFGISGNRILVRTGALEAQASSFGVWRIDNAFATITDIPLWYAKLHQAGYSGRSMSARVKKAGGDRKKALEGLMDEQMAKFGGKYLDKGKVTAVLGGAMPREAAPIPARPFILFQPEDEDDITQVFIDWVGKKIDQAWPRGT